MANKDCSCSDRGVFKGVHVLAPAPLEGKKKFVLIFNVKKIC